MCNTDSVCIIAESIINTDGNSDMKSSVTSNMTSYVKLAVNSIAIIV